MKYLHLFISLILVSCGASGPSFTNPAPSAGKGRVIVYRVPSTPAGRSANVAVNGIKVGTMGMKGFLAYDMPPGRHQIVVTFDKSSAFADVSPAHQNISLHNGERVFLRYGTEAVYGSGSGILLTSPGVTTMLPNYTMRGILSVTPSPQALPEVQRYKMGEQLMDVNRP